MHTSATKPALNIERTTVIECRARIGQLAMALALALAGTSAQAGIFDSLFGGKSGTQVDAAQRLWRIGEFTTVQIVAREPGSSPNQHPARVSSETLRWVLGGVRANVAGSTVALLSADEAGELAEPLAQALAMAGPDDDIVMLSTSRRGANFLTTATGVTARLFVQEGRLQLIVRDARLDFLKDYIASKTNPTFQYGARGTPGKAVLSYSDAVVRRPDWLSLPMALPGAAASPAAVAAPTAAAVQPAMPAATPAAPAVAPAAARSMPVPEAPQTEAEARLQTLKRLRDRGLITEQEYEDKRKEVLKQL